MDDLISRQAAIDALTRLANDLWNQSTGATWARGYEGAADVIENIPSAQPEIVRCKDCKNYHVSPYVNHGIKVCHYWSGTRMDDDFCSRGERKEDG